MKNLLPFTDYSVSHKRRKDLSSLVQIHKGFLSPISCAWNRSSKKPLARWLVGSLLVSLLYSWLNLLLRRRIMCSHQTRLCDPAFDDVNHYYRFPFVPLSFLLLRFFFPVSLLYTWVLFCYVDEITYSDLIVLKWNNVKLTMSIKGNACTNNAIIYRRIYI